MLLNRWPQFRHACRRIWPAVRVTMQFFESHFGQRTGRKITPLTTSGSAGTAPMPNSRRQKTQPNFAHGRPNRSPAPTSCVALQPQCGHSGADARVNRIIAWPSPPRSWHWAEPLGTVQASPLWAQPQQPLPPPRIPQNCQPHRPSPYSRASGSGRFSSTSR